MKTLLAIAALVLASSAAQAQYTFEYGGRTIRIDPDRGTVSIPGVYDNTGRRSKKARGEQTGDKPQKQQPPQEAKVDPQAPPQANAPPPAPAPAAPAVQQAAPTPANTQPIPTPPTVNAQPTDTAVAAPSAPAPQPQQAGIPAPQPASPAPPPATVAVAPASPSQQAPAAARDLNSPVGVWLTEEKEGKVRIEQCGTNLCGYSVDAKSNANGEQVLINMRLGRDLKWNGRILDPNTGSTYDSTIALIGSNTLRVQGCAFGGMFCGGQTWTRVN
ncbi:DUF2147 domain-containing protein [Bradyrhizobium sp. NP1]|uniref:DUF2147 domain-containing protein n=1 Tax=Bradyrhizobium sp. NP1 TaxID=3049772 RepID=UPI0025A54B7F|nr:DUF2147 domain-containing protein [Bradyrhizobium sp. NP1]WJR74887.1 DUF2147 domain-containing protein [Bradyrhizobium sp. NP1]